MSFSNDQIKIIKIVVNFLFWVSEVYHLYISIAYNSMEITFLAFGSTTRVLWAFVQYKVTNNWIWF